MKFKWYRSIAFTLPLKLLALSLISIAVVSWYGYRNAAQNIDAMERSKLEDRASINVKFINNWFRETERNLRSWSESEASQTFLATLHTRWKQSGKPIKEFIRSPEYQELLKIHDDGLVRISENYDYVYDLFLIDTEGNILYTVAKEDDLGTNLLGGSYADTRFAQACRAALHDGKPHFSDLEHYKPSGGIVAGFMCIPMRDEAGSMVGMMALQLRLQSIFDQFAQSNRMEGGVTHYVVGPEGLLRTKIASGDEIMRRRVSTDQFWRWYNEHGRFGKLSEDMEEHAYIYVGPGGKNVLGQHHSIDILGVRWAHISEVDEKKVMEAPLALARKVFILVLISSLVIILAALFIARRITRPISRLSDASAAYINGERDIFVSLDSKDELGQLSGVFNRMIAVQKSNESDLKKHAEEAQKALDQLKEQKFALDAHAIVAITDVKGTIRFINEKFEQISGYGAQELIGANHRILNSGFHPVSFWKEMYDTVSHGHVWHDEVCNRAKDGHLYWVDTTIVPFMGKDGKPESYIAIRSDISKIKEAEKEILAAKDAAESSARAKSEFLAVMSHEIRTPMNGVLGMLGLLAHSPLNETQRHQVRVAHNSANSLLGLINDILDFSKVEAGKMELEKITFDLREELEQFVEAAAFKAHEKKLELVLDTTQLAHTAVIGDPGRLRQILTNLVGNALKFTHHGQILIKAVLDAEDEHRGRLRIDVIDSGIGIAEEKIDSLFESFTQADSSTTRKYGGTGLGLAIVKKLCALMGGSVSASSTLDKGTTFSIAIAIELGTPSAGEEADNLVRRLMSRAQDTEVQWPPETRLLVVDDNSTNQMVVQGILEMFGLSADTANNGFEALEALRLALESAPYTLVLMDCQMPEMDGYEASTAIREGKAAEENKTIPIVAMTANAMSGDRDQCLISGMNDYISKPINPNALKAVLIKWLLGGVLPENGTGLSASAAPTVEEKEFCVWDEADVLNRIRGNEEMLIKIIRSFMADSGRSVSELQEAIANKDFSGAQLHAHSIKGSAGNLSAHKLESLAKKLEFAAQEGKSEVLREGIGDLEAGLKETIEVLETYIKQGIRHGGAKKRIDPLEMAIKLQALKNQIQSGVFIDTSKSGIFGEYADPSLQLKMEQLKHHIDQYNTADAMVAIDAVMSALE